MPGEDTTDSGEVAAARHALVAAIDDGDAAALAALVTDDVVWVVPGQSALAGRHEVESMFADAFSSWTFRFSLEPDRIVPGRPVTAEHGRFRSDVAGGGPTAPTHVGRYLLLWRTTQDGWRIAVYADVTAAHARGGPATT